jgi:hypothetical protein
VFRLWASKCGSEHAIPTFTRAHPHISVEATNAVGNAEADGRDGGVQNRDTRLMKESRMNK